MDKIARIIKSKRIENNYSIEYLSAKLNIKLRYLKAIEDCDYENLPKQVYINGYIKNCVDFLKIENYEHISQNDNLHNNLDIKRNDNRDYKNPSYYSIILSMIMLGIIYNIWHKQYNHQNMIIEARSFDNYVMQKIQNNNIASLRQNDIKKQE